MRDDAFAYSRPKLALYPRGFLGAELPAKIAKIQSPEFQIQAANNTFAVSAPSQTGEIVANDNVEGLYSILLRNSPETLSFDFREKILITAMNAFGDQNFYFWYKAQLRSPAFGQNHSDFLDDTLNFIQTGARRMTVETWGSFVRNEETGLLKQEISEKAAEFFGISSRGVHRLERKSRLMDVIQGWTSQQNGIYDLLQTMHLLFGTY